MTEFVEPLLINFLFILFSIFIYHMVVFKNPSRVYRPRIMTVLVAASVIICMEFGIEIVKGYYYDLRLIPLTLSVLYGGYRVGIGVVLISLIYRYVIGGEGFFVSVVLFIFILVVVSFAKSKFDKSTVTGKMAIAVFFSILFNLLALINFTAHFGLMPISKFEWIAIVLIQVAGTAFATYLIETLQNVEKLQKEAVESEKLKVVSFLAASIAHEVRNPLTVTKGFLQLLKDNDYSSELKEEYINLALQELEAANEIITDYLTFAKPEFEKMEKINLSQELANSIKLIKPLANMNNIFIKTNIEEPAEIKGDSVKLHQCFINIMKNSVESIKESKTDGCLSVSLIKKKKQVEVTISDNGSGMTKEQVNRLGTPYFSTKEQGTGLGMMVVFSLVRAMKGKITVTSEKQKGTKVKIVFPLWNEEEKGLFVLDQT